MKLELCRIRKKDKLKKKRHQELWVKIRELQALYNANGTLTEEQDSCWDELEIEADMLQVELR